MNPVRGEAIYQEIGSQPHAWRELLPQLSSQIRAARSILSRAQHLVFSGCGSGLNAARYGAPLVSMVWGRTAQSIPAADLTLFPQVVGRSPKRTAIILLSRSGRTTEVVDALHAMRSAGFPVLGITCTEDSPLARESNAALILQSVQEAAVTTTRSFTGMLIALQYLAAALAEDEEFYKAIDSLPQACEVILPLAQSAGREMAETSRLRSFAFVGNGPNIGLAHEAQLKIKETTLLPADAYPMLDFRHGPQTTVKPEMLLVALVSRRGLEHETRFIADMHALGAVTCVLCDQASPQLKQQADFLVEFQTGGDDRSLGPLYLPAIHYLAYYRSLAEGLDPDRPENLAYWIDTSGGGNRP